MTLWLCPSCKEPLAEFPRFWNCDNGHTYDKAKEGYVNLLLAQNKNSKSPGDSKDMILARREFLQAGFYDPLIDKIIQLIESHCAEQQLSIFDAGCGEGYYLGRIHQQLSTIKQDSIAEITASGCDISKVGVQKAAKCYPSIKFSVASTFDLPLADNSVDVVIQVFAPSSVSEVARVLKSNGIWIQVNPASEHLHQLKSFLYDDVQPHELINDSYTGFAALERAEIQFDLNLNSEKNRLDLLKMTPYYWSATEQKKERFIEGCDTCSAHFDIQVLRILDE